MTAVRRELEPTVVRAFDRSGDELRLAGLPWPNVAKGDCVESADGVLVHVLGVVQAPAGSTVGALVKVAPLP